MHYLQELTLILLIRNCNKIVILNERKRGKTIEIDIAELSDQKRDLETEEYSRKIYEEVEDTEEDEV